LKKEKQEVNANNKTVGALIDVNADDRLNDENRDERAKEVKQPEIIKQDKNMLVKPAQGN